jgi:hypothetical protein
VIPVALVAAQSTTVLISTGGALLGVLVGGAINWAIQSGNERRRERTLAQAGVRLVSAELADCDRELEETLKDLVWRRTRTLPTNAWATYREPLALCLPTIDFDLVANAVGHVQRLGAVLEALLGTGSTTSPLSEERRTEISEVRESLSSARARLDAFDR